MSADPRPDMVTLALILSYLPFLTRCARSHPEPGPCVRKRPRAHFRGDQMASMISSAVAPCRGAAGVLTPDAIRALRHMRDRNPSTASSSQESHLQRRRFAGGLESRGRPGIVHRGARGLCDTTYVAMQ